MSKHTPGPWEWGSVNGMVDNYINVYAANSAKGDKLVAQCHAKRARADAALISAAPDLLEACRAALDIAEGLDEFHDGDVGADARRLLAAAIAKAEGKE